MQALLISVVACLFCIPLVAQDSLQVSDHAKSTAIVWKLSRELGLSEKQETQVYEIMMRRWSALDQVRSQKLGGRQSVGQATLTELRSVLTTDQLLQFLSLRDKRKSDMEDFISKNPEYTFDETDMDLEL